MTPEQEAALRAQVARETVGGFRRTIDPLSTVAPAKTVGQSIVHRNNDLPPGVPDYNRGPLTNPVAPMLPTNSPATSKIQQLLDSSRARLSSWLGLSTAGNLSTAPQLGGGAGTQNLPLSPDQIQGSPITNALGMRNLNANPQGASVITNRTRDLESGLDALQQRSTQLSKSPSPRAIEGQTGMASTAPATSPVFDMRANLISAAQPPAKQAQAPA